MKKIIINQFIFFLKYMAKSRKNRKTLTPWQTHVSQTKQSTGLKGPALFKQASKTYDKNQKGGSTAGHYASNERHSVANNASSVQSGGNSRWSYSSVTDSQPASVGGSRRSRSSRSSRRSRRR
jgi:hypothetical protein